MTVLTKPVLTERGYAYLPYETVKPYQGKLFELWFNGLKVSKKEAHWLWVNEEIATEMVFGEYPALPAFLSSVRRRGHVLVVEWSEPHPTMTSYRKVLRVIQLMTPGIGGKFHRVAR